MKSHRNKSQAAMEFLMTYGWALMSALVIIGVLYNYGAFNPLNLKPDSCDFDLGIECKDFKLAPDGEDELVLKIGNTFSKPIIIYRIDLENQGSLVDDCYIAFNDSDNSRNNCSWVDSNPLKCTDNDGLDDDTGYNNKTGFYLSPTQEASVNIPCDNLDFDGKRDIPLNITYYYAEANYSYAYSVGGNIYAGI